MISVTAAAGETVITIETDSSYSPDLIDDLSRRAVSSLLSALISMIASVESLDDDDE